jgi:sugar/nucleoside kinase (ribokinase family)
MKCGCECGECMHDHVIEEPDKVADYIKNAFAKGAKAVTILNGKPAPWTPFGMDVDPREFTRSGAKEKEERCKRKDEV